MATSYLSPGVYVEEVDRGSKPIEAVGTNTVGFLGESSKGPVNEAVLVTNWSQFVKTFGDFAQCSPYLAHAVYGFFNNGGSRCFIVNVGGGGDEPELNAAPVGPGDGKDGKEPKKSAPKGPVDKDALYIGRDGGPGRRSGIKCFEEVDEVAILAAPGQVSPAVQDALLTHCETRKDRFAILDSPETISGGIDRLPKPRDSKYGAYYFPWIQVYDPDKGNVYVPPSGHIAGVWARTDETRGVWKAPANDTIRGVLDLERGVTQNEQSLLNPMGINCIRPFGTRGIRIWGARTLASDSDWRYINVRRLFNMVETTILEGTQWAVFEPNDMTLWEGVKRTLNGFLRGLWSAGALFGATADQAFYVKCDAETNPPESIDEGKLVVEVGIAPVKPAEFVIFRISQQKQVAN